MLFLFLNIATHHSTYFDSSALRSLSQKVTFDNWRKLVNISFFKLLFDIHDVRRILVVLNLFVSSPYLFEVLMLMATNAMNK